MPPSDLDGGTGGAGTAACRVPSSTSPRALAHATELTPEHLTAIHRRKTRPISNEHTLDQLRSLRLGGMVRAIEEQATSTAAVTLSFG